MLSLAVLVISIVLFVSVNLALPSIGRETEQLYFVVIRFLFFTDALENLESLGLPQAAWPSVNKNCRVCNQAVYIDTWTV